MGELRITIPGDETICWSGYMGMKIQTILFDWITRVESGEANCGDWFKSPQPVTSEHLRVAKEYVRLHFPRMEMWRPVPKGSSIQETYEDAKRNQISRNLEPRDERTRAWYVDVLERVDRDASFDRAEKIDDELYPPEITKDEHTRAWSVDDLPKVDLDDPKYADLKRDMDALQLLSAPTERNRLVKEAARKARIDAARQVLIDENAPVTVDLSRIPTDVMYRELEDRAKNPLTDEQLAKEVDRVNQLKQTIEDGDRS